MTFQTLTNKLIFVLESVYTLSGEQSNKTVPVAIAPYLAERSRRQENTKKLGKKSKRRMDNQEPRGT